MPVRVCTYNLRVDVPRDGANSFAGRKGLIQRCFPELAPDIVGFQEAAPHMRQWLADTFPEYQVCGVGREADLQGESNPIAFRRDRFELVSLAFFWLSDTPHVPGSRFSTDQSQCPRVCTGAVLRQRGTGALLRFYNTHLDHEGPIAQAQGLSLILSRMAEDYARWPLPVVLAGDFNALPDSPVYRSAQGFAGCGAPLRDVTQNIPGSFHDFGRLARPEKIDYIFTGLPCPGPAAAAMCEEGGVFLSDHYPLWAQLELDGR